MAISELYTGTWTSTSTETKLNTTTPETTDGIYQLFVDFNAVTVGKTIFVRIKEKTISGGTQRLCFEAAVTGVIAQPLWVSPSLILLWGWDITLQELTSSSSFSMPWSIRSVA